MSFMQEIEIYVVLVGEWEEIIRQSEPPRLVVQQFSMEALHHVMLLNNSQMLVLNDEMSVMYGQFDALMNSRSTIEQSTLLDRHSRSACI